MFALRGATSVPENTAEAIERATAELVGTVLARNGLPPERIVSAFFTATADLDATFPATGARRAGFHAVPMLCAQEISVPGSPPRIVRALFTVDGPPVRPVQHVYLGEAAQLRPDLAPASGSAGEESP